MATAEDIVSGDGKGLTWLEFLDTDGGKSTYHRARPAADGATVHVYQHDNGRLEIMPDGVGGVLLRQNGPQLPRTINVRLATPPLPGPGTGVVAGFGGGVFVYEQR
jgi:hypothetical protein